jgi:hypothetical protein
MDFLSGLQAAFPKGIMAQDALRAARPAVLRLVGDATIIS